MKVDSNLAISWGEIPKVIRELELLGYDGVGTSELSHDPFFPLFLAAEHSERIELYTSIAVAFARSPANLASLAHDLNSFSGGRFTLGLGSQIRAHITKRFSMPFSNKPARQMRELIQAVRAIWLNWYEGKALSFEGEYYAHTLMTPAFTPKDINFGMPRIALAAVGPVMTQVAGELADGIILHSFTNETFIREVTLPAIDKGLAKSGRSRKDFEIIYSPFIISGETEEIFEENKKAVREKISFYGSTPAYRNVLRVHDWGDLQVELNEMSKRGLWDEMPKLISDEMLNTFAIMDKPENIVSEIKRRYGDFLDRTDGSFSFVSSDKRLSMVADLRNSLPERR